jgi:hypothetical protein
MIKPVSALIVLALCSPVVVTAQDLFAGTWRTDPKQPTGLGTTITYSTSSEGIEHYSNNRNHEYDFALDGRDYPTDHPGSTVRWDSTGASSWSSVEAINGKVIREIQLRLSPDNQTLTTTYTWFNPGDRTARGSTIFTRVSGGPGLDGSWKIVQRVEEPDTLTIAFPAPGQLYLYIDPIDYTWAGPLNGSFHAVQCPMLSPGTSSSFQLAGPRRMNVETKLNDKTAYIEKWEISMDGKMLTRTTWPPGHEDKTSTVILKRQ